MKRKRKSKMKNYEYYASRLPLDMGRSSTQGTFSAKNNASAKRIAKRRFKYFALFAPKKRRRLAKLIAVRKGRW